MSGFKNMYFIFLPFYQFQKVYFLCAIKKIFIWIFFRNLTELIRDVPEEFQFFA